MDELKPISSYWSSQPPLELVHVVALDPDTAKSGIPLQGALKDTQFLPKDDRAGPLEDWNPVLKTTIGDCLQTGVQLTQWSLKQGSEEMRSYVAGLGLPASFPSSSFPSLLLHNLGELSHDQLLARRIEGLFSGCSRVRSVLLSFNPSWLIHSSH
jgi:hypothetical protein